MFLALSLLPRSFLDIGTGIRPALPKWPSINQKLYVFSGPVNLVHRALTSLLPLRSTRGQRTLPFVLFSACAPWHRISTGAQKKDTLRQMPVESSVGRRFHNNFMCSWTNAHSFNNQLLQTSLLDSFDTTDFPLSRETLNGDGPSTKFWFSCWYSWRFIS